MTGFTVDITNDIPGKLKEITGQVKAIVTDEMNDFGRATVEMAKNLCPVDVGFLRNAITFDPLSDPVIGVEIIVGVNYAAYIEFGTRGFAAEYVATLPQTWQAFAETFQGKGGGDYYDFLNAILDWVIRKGIAARFSVKTHEDISIELGSGSDDETRFHDAAYAIALSIIRNGIRPHPYLYPAIEQNLIILKDNLNAQLK